MARHFKVVLFKIKSKHQNLRTPVIEGICKSLPAVGEDFYMTGEGLEFGTRLVRTTPVLSVMRLNDTFLFETANSTYTVRVDEEFDDEAVRDKTIKQGKTI